MSRNKRHGNARPASGKIVLDSVAKAQIAKAMQQSFADRHPVGTATINENGIQTEMPLKQIVEEYARMKNPDAEITIEIKTNDDRRKH